MVLEFMPPMENMLLPLQEPFRLFEAFWIMAGLYMLLYLMKAIDYEIKYGLGEEFFQNRIPLKKIRK